MKLHHIGYAVDSIGKAISKFEKLGYEFENIIEDKERNINICLGKSEDCQIELISPAGEKCAVDGILQRNGNGAYHVCYETNDYKKVIDELQQDGYWLIAEPRPAIAFGGREVAFLYYKDIGLIEVIEEEKKSDES